MVGAARRGVLDATFFAFAYRGGNASDAFTVRPIAAAAAVRTLRPGRTSWARGTRRTSGTRRPVRTGLALRTSGATGPSLSFGLLLGRSRDCGPIASGGCRFRARATTAAPEINFRALRSARRYETKRFLGWRETAARSRRSWPFGPLETSACRGAPTAALRAASRRRRSNRLKQLLGYRRSEKCFHERASFRQALSSRQYGEPA
jgi:hypothetical protein